MQNVVEKILSGFQQCHVLVVGDIMLDSYYYGTSDRMSPEAPVPVVHVKNRESVPGGAANVAINIKALSASASLVAITGDDKNGETLKSLIESNDISVENISVSPNRITTVKSRIFNAQQQVVRFDEEQTDFLSETEFEEVRSNFDLSLKAKKPSCVVLQDYNKGLLTPQLVQYIIATCKKENIPVAVDPKLENFFSYEGVTLFKPNLREVRDALKKPELQTTEKALSQCAIDLNSKLENAITMITLAEKGIFITDHQTFQLVPANKRSVLDVSGAGDTVISAAALCLSLGADLTTIAEIANAAGGIACENMGAKPISFTQLKKEILT